MIFVLNTASMGVSEYTAEWVDICADGNKLYALSATSLGFQDPEAEFSGPSYITTGKLAIAPGTSFNVHPAYIPLTAAEEVTLTTTVSGYGTEVEYDYAIPVLASTEERERYVPLSRRVEGNYWQFTLGTESGGWGITGFGINIERARRPKR